MPGGIIVNNPIQAAHVSHKRHDSVSSVMSDITMASLGDETDSSGSESGVIANANDEAPATSSRRGSLVDLSIPPPLPAIPLPQVT